MTSSKLLFYLTDSPNIFCFLTSEKNIKNDLFNKIVANSFSASWLIDESTYWAFNFDIYPTLKTTFSSRLYADVEVDEVTRCSSSRTNLSLLLQKCEASPWPRVHLHRAQTDQKPVERVYRCRVTVYLSRIRAFVCNLDLIFTCSNTGSTREPDPLQLCSSRRRVHRIQALRDLQESVCKKTERKKDGGRSCWLSSGWLNTEACWARKFLRRRQLLLRETAPRSVACCVNTDPGPAAAQTLSCHWEVTGLMPSVQNVSSQ